MATLTAGSTIGVVGLGNLGRPMALNLIDKGWHVVVHDPNDERADELVDAGAASGVDAMATADVICFVVPDETAIWATLRGGMLSTLSSGRTVVVHSTILPGRAEELGAAVRESGAAFAMAPVSGGAERARRGDVSLIAGADANTMSFLQPLFDSMSRETFHVGHAAAACATKLANQLVMFSALAGLHEAMSLAQKYRVADSDLLRVLATATGDTWVGRNWGFFDDVAADYERTGAPLQGRPWSKDLWEVLEAAREANISAPIAATLSQVVPRMVEDHARDSSQRQQNVDEGVRK